MTRARHLPLLGCVARHYRDLEFFHDKDGLTTSKAGLLTAIEKDICGAVDMGFHVFRSSEDLPDRISRPAKYSMAVSLQAGFVDRLLEDLVWIMASLGEPAAGLGKRRSPHHPARIHEATHK